MKFLLILNLFYYCLCWKDVGHMLVVQIARQVLKTNDDNDGEEYITAELLNDALNFDPNTSFPNLLLAAIFPDHIYGYKQTKPIFKYKGEATWHFEKGKIHVPKRQEDENLIPEKDHAIEFLVKFFKLFNFVFCNKWLKQYY